MSTGPPGGAHQDVAPGAQEAAHHELLSATDEVAYITAQERSNVHAEANAAHPQQIARTSSDPLELIPMIDSCESELEHARKLILIKKAMIDRAITLVATVRNQLALGSISANDAFETMKAEQAHLQSSFPQGPLPLFKVPQASMPQASTLQNESCAPFPCRYLESFTSVCGHVRLTNSPCPSFLAQVARQRGLARCISCGSSPGAPPYALSADAHASVVSTAICRDAATAQRSLK